jgi:endonuclease/exonuclease/phosphatase family metal-dependent hydrolase
MVMRKISVLTFTVLIFAFTACSHSEKDSIVKVITFNIRYDNQRDGINAWNNRKEQLANFIIEEEPDIFGMQEVLWHQYAWLDSVLTGYSSIGAGRDDGLKGGEMNPVFFRKEEFEMVRSKTFWLSETTEMPGSKGWGASLPRIVTWMELVKMDTHEHFFFFNTHFAHDSDSARIMSSKILLDKALEIAGSYPFIITGDFNQLPNSVGYGVLTGPEENTSLLKDSFFISDEKPSGPSFTFNGFSDEPGSGRIDYVFVRNGMKVLSHRTVPHKQGQVFISDHWPVAAEVSIDMHSSKD